MQIRFKKLSKYYSESCAVQEATGLFETGEKILITGENGSGKSTFLKLISGQIAPTSGEILLNSKKLNGLDRKNFSILGESRFLYFDLTLKENLDLSLFSSEQLLKAQELCHNFELILASRKTVRQLSSGQKQKTALVKVLSSKSEILVLDEPFNFLDLDSKLKLAKILQETNKTVIATSHEIELFKDYRQLTLQNGVLLC